MHSLIPSSVMCSTISFLSFMYSPRFLLFLLCTLPVPFSVMFFPSPFSCHILFESLLTYVLFWVLLLSCKLRSPFCVLCILRIPTSVLRTLRVLSSLSCTLQIASSAMFIVRLILLRNFLTGGEAYSLFPVWDCVSDLSNLFILFCDVVT